MDKMKKSQEKNALFPILICFFCRIAFFLKKIFKTAFSMKKRRLPKQAPEKRGDQVLGSLI